MNTTNIIKPAKGKKISFEMVLELLDKDGLISKESLHLSRTLIKKKDIDSLGAIGAIGRKNWPNHHKPGEFLDTEFISSWYAKKFNLNYIPINPVHIDNEMAVQSLNQLDANRFNALVISSENNIVRVATSEPFDSNLDYILSHDYKTIEKIFVNPDEIRELIDKVYSFKKSLNRAHKDIAEENSELQNLEQLLKLGDNNSKGEDKSIVNIVDWLMQFAISLKASDIHIEPRRKKCMIRYRIDGIMNNVYEIPIKLGPAIVSRIKILSRMDVAEKRKPQDGRIKTLTKKKQEIEFRVSTMPTAFGEKIVMRIFDPEVLKVGLEEIGFSNSELKKYKSLIKHENGLVLITGPTGSGKTTTLYTTLKTLATNEVNICTVEDPIELIHDSFNQMQVQQKIGLSFANGIRTMLRQDPDIVMVGEIRDHDAAIAAAQASLTGHLVLSTLHTNDSITAITRLQDLNLPNYLITNTLRGVVAMRLVRALCKNCKKPIPAPAKNIWDDFCKPYSLPVPEMFYQPVGCKKCRNYGFTGRVALFEILIIDSQMRELIYKDNPLADMVQSAVKGGMIPLRIAGAQKVATGITTINEILLSTPEIISY